MSNLERPSRLSEHASPDGIEAVAFDLLIDQGYSLDVFDHMRSHRDYILRIRGKLKGHWHDNSSARNAYRNGITYEVPLVWSIGNIECWCSKKDTDALFAQIRVELGGFDENTALDRVGTEIGPKLLMVESGQVWLTSSRWSDIRYFRPTRLDGPAELVEAADRRQDFMQRLDP